jgi:hypothetical protein
MPEQQTSQPIPEWQKRHWIEQMRGWSDEQMLNFLNNLAANGWNWNLFLPSTMTYTFTCDVPNNNHSETAAHYYRCPGISAQSIPPHDFCEQHQLSNCPTHNITLTYV